MARRLRVFGLLACVLACGLAACSGPSAPQVAPAPAPAPAGKIVLSAGGILVAGTGKEISFWRTEASTLAAVTRLEGRAPTDVKLGDGCRVHIWKRGLALVFVGGNFRGWSAPERKYEIASAAGLPDGRAQAGLGCAITSV